MAIYNVQNFSTKNKTYDKRQVQANKYEFHSFILSKENKQVTSCLSIRCRTKRKHTKKKKTYKRKKNKKKTTKKKTYDKSCKLCNLNEIHSFVLSKKEPT